MGNIFQAKLALASASANNIAQSQTPGGAGNLTLNGALVSGGVATLDAARRVLFTPAGAEAGNSTVWTVYGTSRDNIAISEVVNGVNNPSTASTVQDFKTVTRIAVNKAQAGAVTVGTSGVASTQWFMLNNALTPMNVGLAVVVFGTINYTVEYTYDDPNAPFTGTYPTVFSISALGSKTQTLDGSLTTPVFAVRLTQNSFTNPATASIIAIQSGLG